MSKSDPWNTTDQLDVETLAVMVERLEARAQPPAFVAMLDEYLDAMSIDTAASVLDLGCGTGVASRRICARPGFRGKCIGIDLSPYMVAEAGRLSTIEGRNDCVRFETGDTHSLGLADASFDAVVAHTLFSHVDDPLAVLGEAARVTRSGGKIAVFDGDYASQTFEQEDPQKSKADSETFIRSVVAQPRVLRQMPRLAKHHGLRILSVFPNMITDVGEADFWRSAVEAFRRLGPRSGLISAEAANSWADDQLRASDEGVFFASSNYYGYVLEKG